ncbi:uncharacterized protein LOC114519802 [Dendronephthya gigantea]|uniref:uncharacterized protein LOC114519802 n=1 Tax=Dendronephthya gigantea TaxID=151771 RepID=UPI00106C2DD5|nr:uncharacterized protein LOC114519802 [Dendronephthya gigantea]
MDKVLQILRNSWLIIFVLNLELSSVHCCLPEPENAVLPPKFIFEAFPSVNVSLGDRLEIKCSAQNTSNINSIQLLTRNEVKQFKPTCNVSSDGGVCSFVIKNVELWHFGKYDCIKIYKDMRCYSKSLIIGKAVVNPTSLTTSTTKSLKTIAMNPETATTMRLRETTVINTQTTTHMETEETLLEEVTKKTAVNVTIIVSENPTSNGCRKSISSRTLGFVILAFTIAVAWVI